MNSVISNNLSFKYQKFTSIDFKDIGISNFEFVSKTKFLKKPLSANISVFQGKIIPNNLPKKRGCANSSLHPPLPPG